MAMNSGNKGDVFSEINITPLTDIFLVLLIIMMVVAPTFQSMNKDIKMPKMNSGVAIEEKNVTVAVNKDGIFFLNSKQIDKEGLTQELKKLLPGSTDKAVVVKADAKTKSGAILTVMHSAQNAGFEKLTVAGEPLSSEQAEQLQNSNNIETQTGIVNE